VEGCSFHVPEASVSDEEVSEEEETDSDEDDLRPAQRAEKKPVGAYGAAGSGQGEGERASSEGVPIADAPEEQPEQEEEEEEEYVEDDDEYAPAAAPARPVRRVAGGQQPARISVALAPAINSRKATAWSAAEDAACIKLMKEVCTLAQYAAIAGTEKRFEVVADRMQREAGFVRTASGVKLQWNRRLRLASKFEDRGEKKRASGLTTSALGQGTKRGTLAVTSLVATPSSGTNSSSSPAQSTETSNLPSSRNGKRKAITIDSDDEGDDDFLSAPRPSKPAKRVRSTSVASSSAVPSTQDVAYYDLSTKNIITGSRASRHRRAPTVEASSAVTPARSSRQKPTTTNDDDEEEIIPPPKPSTRSSLLKRARTINDDVEDEEPSTAPPQPKRSKVSDEQSNSDTQPKRKRMANFDPVNKYSKKDGRLLDRKKKSDYIEWINPAMHDQRPITPEPAYNSKAYWEKLLRDRQAALARQREEAERERQAQEEEDEEDEDPILTTADKAKKDRELRRQRQNAAMNKSPSPAGPLSPVKPSSITKPSSSTKPSSTTMPTSMATTAPNISHFSAEGPVSASILASVMRPSAVFTRPAQPTRTSPYTRPSLTDRISSNAELSSFRRTSITGRPLGSIDHRASNRPSSTTSSSTVNHDRNTTQRDHRNQQPSSSSSRRWEAFRRGIHAELSPISEQSEDSMGLLEQINHNNAMRANLFSRDAAAASQVATDATAAQVATDEEMARQLHEEMNGAPPRSRRGRGFR
jgi:hypothetical protein